MLMLNKPIEIYTQVGNKSVANNIARSLIAKNLAAAVHAQKIESTYIWNNAICTREEYKLTIKSNKSNLAKIEALIIDAHPYKTPDIHSIAMDYVNKDYAIWLEKSVS